MALVDAVTYLRAADLLSDPQPISCGIAAVSVGGSWTDECVSTFRTKRIRVLRST